MLFKHSQIYDNSLKKSLFLSIKMLRENLEMLLAPLPPPPDNIRLVILVFILKLNFPNDSHCAWQWDMSSSQWNSKSRILKFLLRQQ